MSTAIASEPPLLCRGAEIIYRKVKSFVKKSASRKGKTYRGILAKPITVGSCVELFLKRHHQYSNKVSKEVEEISADGKSFQTKTSKYEVISCKPNPEKEN
jgi:hypothetical protein